MLADISDADLAAMLDHFDSIEQRLAASQLRRSQETGE
jgi:MarR family transcriptional regulator for hemolysin